MISILRKDIQKTHRKGDVRPETGIWVMWPQAREKRRRKYDHEGTETGTTPAPGQNCQQQPEGGRGKRTDSPLETLERVQLC